MTRRLQGVIAMTVRRRRGRPSDYSAEIAMTICDRAIVVRVVLQNKGTWSARRRKRRRRAGETPARYRVAG
jgi:hypothetical protein